MKAIKAFLEKRNQRQSIVEKVKNDLRGDYK